MEEFCSDIIQNICLDHENSTVKDITTGLEILVNRFVGLLTKRFPDFEVKRVTRCGSMTEKTRIKDSEGLEYDYIIEMESWPGCGELKFRTSCEGSMQPLFRVSNKKDVCLSTNVKYAFWKNLSKSIKKSCKNNFCPSKYSRFQNNCEIAEGCQNCSVYVTTGCLRLISFGNPYRFVFESRYPLKDNYSYPTQLDIKYYAAEKLRDVLLDIHPVLIVTPKRLIVESYSEKSDDLTKLTYFHYLFPNHTTNHSPSCHGGMGCWRISHYDTEVQILQQTCQMHRNMYMIMKFIFKNIFKTLHFGVSSYEVKTVVLHHINSCKLPDPDLGRCLLSTLKLLSKCFIEQNLPNIGSAYNILLLKIHHSFEDDTPIYNRIVGFIWKALYDLFTTGIKTGTAGVLIDLKAILAEADHVLDSIKNRNSPLGYETDNLCRDADNMGRDADNKCRDADNKGRDADNIIIDALKKYVDERTRRTADLYVYELEMKSLRFNRLNQLLNRDSQELNEREKMKVEKEVNLLKSNLRYRFNLTTFTEPKMLKGCYL